MRVCAGIVLFHPNIERIEQNIKAVLPQVDKLIFINNAPEESEKLREVCLKLSGDLIWIDNEKNAGIAAALNQLMKCADEGGFRWILTLDQDSICGDGLVDKLLDAGKSYANAAMISPQIIERGKLWDDYGTMNINADKPGEIDEVLHCITSGTLTNVKAVLDNGGFNEWLFIDEVDRDMCIRLRYRGFRLLRVNAARMQHEFGEKLVRRKILFKTYEYRNYSPERVYYQIRNRLYMIRKYRADYRSHPIWQRFRPLFTFTVKFIFEPKRLKRLPAFVRGYFAGLFAKI